MISNDQNSRVQTKALIPTVGGYVHVIEKGAHGVR